MEAASRTPSPVPSAPCTPRHQLITWVVLALFAGSVIESGLASLLDRQDLSLWPWNRAWFMFSWSDGNLHHIEVVGELTDSSTAVIDLTRWFSYPVAFDTLRSDEVSWTLEHFRKLALFAAHRHNADAPLERRIVNVSLFDVAWKCPPGTRIPFRNASGLQQRRLRLVDRLPCTSGTNPHG